MAAKRERWRVLTGAACAAVCIVGATRGGVAGAAARSPGRMASATRQDLHSQTFRGAPAGQVPHASLPNPPACPNGSERPFYRYTRYSFTERAADLVSCMTLAEKIGQLHTTIAPAIPRLGVQRYAYDSEGLHGVFRLGDDTNPGGQAGRHASATSFPANFAATMSWDPQLIYAESTAISDEARGFLDKSLWGSGANNLGPSRNDYGSLTYWAPTVNMDRDPRWGRTDEAFGEDPYLAAQIAGAFVNGYQGQTITGQPIKRFLKIAATAKHYALNDVEDNRMAISSDTDDANIRDYYTAQFRSLAENAHVAGLMTSYNAINGTPAVADTYTVNELAQRTYGFSGYTTSDCGAIGTTYQNPPSGHDWAPPGWTTNNGGASAVWTNTKTGQKISGAAGGQAYAVRAGTELNCQGTEYTSTNIEDAFKAGILDEGVLDDALTHVFTVRMETGEFNPPQYVPYTKITKAAIQSHAHQALAEKVAANDLVLLHNGNVPGTSNPLLPADAPKLKKIVIVGNLADTVTLGGYSGDPKLQVNAVRGIRAAVKAASPRASVVFDSCHTSTTTRARADCSATTRAAIKSASLVIVFVGTDENIARENTALGVGPDRTTLAMPGNYDSLISQVAALGNPKMALVIQSDGPVDIANVQRDFPAIVFSGYNGESQGTALASVLFGTTDPAGHLDFTWYAGTSQLPPMRNYGLTPGQTGGLGRTYLYFTKTPTYPFGYGLSYTTFGYSKVSADRSAAPASGTVDVSFTVTNTGHVPGATVAQLYVSTPFTVRGTELPAERLEGFRRTRVLAPGQSQRITLTVPVPNLSFWNEQQLKETVYDGPYRFGVGADSAHIVAAPRVQVTGTVTPHVRYVTIQPGQVIFKRGQTLDLTGKNPWIAPDTNPAMEQQHAEADHIVEAVNNDQSFVNLSHATVTYSSSDPAVATVSKAGLLQATGPGVATISVTVDGVTGSAPIVVQ
jgi:beta-glucosidase